MVVTLALMVFFLGLQTPSLGQSTTVVPAISDGTVVVEVANINTTLFNAKRALFGETVAEYASIHCKRSISNCQTEDKQIRAGDVIVTRQEDEGDNVEANLHVRDRFDNRQPALTKWQLAEVFRQYETDINRDYGHKVRLLDPVYQGWQTWHIAVAVVVPVLLLAVVVLSLVFGCRNWNKDRSVKREEEHAKRISLYDSVIYRQEHEETNKAQDTNNPQQTDKMEANGSLKSPTMMDYTILPIGGDTEHTHMAFSSHNIADAQSYASTMSQNPAVADPAYETTTL